MSKRHEAALKVKPIYAKGAQSLGDADALTVKGIYPDWVVGEEVKTREKRNYNGRLYRCPLCTPSQFGGQLLCTCGGLING